MAGPAPDSLVGDTAETMPVDLSNVANIPESQPPSSSPPIATSELRSRFQGKDVPTPPADKEETPATWSLRWGDGDEGHSAVYIIYIVLM